MSAKRYIMVYRHRKTGAHAHSNAYFDRETCFTMSWPAKWQPIYILTVQPWR